MKTYNCEACGTTIFDIDEPCPNCLPGMAWRKTERQGLIRVKEYAQRQVELGSDDALLWAQVVSICREYGV